MATMIDRSERAARGGSGPLGAEGKTERRDLITGLPGPLHY